jgi:DNA polymerase III subunit epsilon
MGKDFTLEWANENAKGQKMNYGLIVDVETTGLKANQDVVIELGLVEFQIDQNGAPSITGMYSGLEDPKVPLSAEITQLTQLTDDVLKGQEIDWGVVRKYWDRASVVIAHNAEFDRGFLQARPELRDYPKHWACTMRHIDWRSKNFGNLKLQYLAADHGFANPFAHRAMFDCATTFRLAAPHLTELVESSYEPEYELIAVGSPFETKDILKKAGYRWDAEQRAWRIRVGPGRLKEAREFLSSEVYKGPSRHVELETFFNPQ